MGIGFTSHNMKEKSGCSKYTKEQARRISRSESIPEASHCARGRRFLQYRATTIHSSGHRPSKSFHSQLIGGYQNLSCYLTHALSEKESDSLLAGAKLTRDLSVRELIVPGLIPSEIFQFDLIVDAANNICINVGMKNESTTGRHLHRLDGYVDLFQTQCEKAIKKSGLLDDGTFDLTVRSVQLRPYSDRVTPRREYVFIPELTFSRLYQIYKPACVIHQPIPEKRSLSRIRTAGSCHRGIDSSKFLGLSHDPICRRSCWTTWVIPENVTQGSVTTPRTACLLLSNAANAWCGFIGPVRSGTRGSDLLAPDVRSIEPSGSGLAQDADE
ncbi:hypothetical protein C8J56DRAFT_906997 [Mycena floridula]|nr:hypothetical protein C8J56DRAFT_906997 [Mycena floridula]